jgi:hypothetical protein
MSLLIFLFATDISTKHWQQLHINLPAVLSQGTRMNIQHFSSLDAILIDADSYSQENVDRLSPHTEQSPLASKSVANKHQEESFAQDRYDEESFEHESHAITAPSYSHDYGSGDEENYENTFEETGVTFQSQNPHEDDGYENTFEAEYSHSVVAHSTPCPSIQNTISNQENEQLMSMSPENKLSQAVGSMSGIKQTENIKTFADLAMMSTPSSSNQSTPRVDSFGSDPMIQSPLFVHQPPKNKLHLIPHSSESTARIQPSHIPRYATSNYPEGVKSSAPKLFSKVQILSKEDIQKLHLKPEEKRNSKQNHSPFPSQSSTINWNKVGNGNGNGNIDPWNFTTEDLQTMKRAKEILNKIEVQQKSLQDQQTHHLVRPMKLTDPYLYAFGFQTHTFFSPLSSPCLLVLGFTEICCGSKS